MFWQMFLPSFLVTDVIATTYCIVNLLADVIASVYIPLIVAFQQFYAQWLMFIATSWLMLFGRCCCQVAGVIAIFDDSSSLAGVIARWLREYPPWVWFG